MGGCSQEAKTFFFLDTEGLRLVWPTSLNVRIPSSQFESATLANLANASPASVPFYQRLFNLYNNAPGANRAQNLLPPRQDANGNPTGNGCGTFALPGG